MTYHHRYPKFCIYTPRSLMVCVPTSLLHPHQHLHSYEPTYLAMHTLAYECVSVRCRENPILPSGVRIYQQCNIEKELQQL